MEKLGRRSEEETYLNYLWSPFQFLNRTLKAIFKCLGLLHQDSPKTTKTASPPVTLNQPEEDEDIATKEEVVVASRGIKYGVVVTSRATKIKAKPKKKERVSSGRPGQHS